MTAALYDVDFGAAVRFCNGARIALRYEFVLVSVHEQQRSGCESTGGINRTKSPEFATPLVELLWKRRSSNGTDLAGVLEESPRLIGPVVEIGTSTEEGAAAHARIIGCDAQTQRCSGVGTEHPHLRGLGFGDEMVDCRPQILHPTLQRKIALTVATSTERERHPRPSEFVGDAIDQFRKRTGGMSRVLWADRESMAKQHGRT